jgi:hypothetical protein
MPAVPQNTGSEAPSLRVVGLPEVTVLAVDDPPGGAPIVVYVESRLERAWCRVCGCPPRGGEARYSESGLVTGGLV